mgnify:CR=1 FL=1
MGPMGFIDRLRADLKRATIEHQRALVVELLHQRFAELTLDDVRSLLASPLGQGLGEVRVADLLPPTTSPPRKASTTSKPSTPRRGPGQKKRRSKARVPARRARAAAARRTKDQIQKAIVSALRSAAAPLYITEIAAKTSVHRKAIGRAIGSLLAGGQVITTGEPKRPHYALSERPTGEGERAASAMSSNKKARPKAKARAASTTSSGKKVNPKSKGRQVTARTVEGRKNYDAAVVEALRAAGGWVAASAIRKRVGGTANQVRIALDRLRDAGRVVRQGAKGATRYSLVAQS